MRDGDEEAIRWLSYSQIAELRGISRTSAERLVRRAKWRRQVDNQGVTKAAVPLAYAEPIRTSPPDRQAESQAESPPDRALFEVALAAIREAKDGEIAALTGQVDVLRQQLVRADARADGFQVKAEQALQMAEELRQADAARRGQGRWARLRAAWKGE
jgi:hypothetical protein